MNTIVNTHYIPAIFVASYRLLALLLENRTQCD